MTPVNCGTFIRFLKFFISTQFQTFVINRLVRNVMLSVLKKKNNEINS